jgi:hypothetical protein
VQEDGAVAEAALALPLSRACKPLLAVLCSSPSGLGLLTSDATTLPALLDATDPGTVAPDLLEVESKKSTSKRRSKSGSNDQEQLRRAEGAVEHSSNMAAILGAVAIADAAATDISSHDIGTGEFRGAVATLAGLLGTASGRRAALSALTRHAEAAVPCLLRMVSTHCHLLREAAGVIAPAAAEEEEESMAWLTDAASDCEPALDILSAMVGEAHPAASALWARFAQYGSQALGSDLASLAQCDPADVAHTADVLAWVRGALAAAEVAHNGGLEDLVALTAAELPQVVLSAGGTSAPAKGLFTVEWAATEAFFARKESLGACQVALRHVSTLLWSPECGTAAAAAAHYAGLPAVLVRALRTGTELLAAAQADRDWVRACGEAISPGASSRGRLRALAFLEATAAAASCMLQHLRGLAPPAGESLLAALLDAHASIIADEECLAVAFAADDAVLAPSAREGGLSSATGAAVVDIPPGSPRELGLATRAHLTSCLRCYVESPSWGQALLPALLLGGSRGPGGAAAAAAPGAAVLPPRRMLAAACLLGDLFPEEWPAAGRKAAQAPPSSRAYRAALALVSDL